MKVKSKNYFAFTDFAKIKPLLTHDHKTPPLRSHYLGIFALPFECNCINLFQFEVAKLKVAKHICPTEGFQYKKIDGKCFYFEKKKLSYFDAKANCKEKLSLYGQGKLFEPNTRAVNDKIAQMFKSLFGSMTWPHIGVNDVSQEGKFVYNTGLPINFTPTWGYSGGSRGADYNCVCLGHNSSYMGKWYDGECSQKRPSICEA